MYNLQKQINTLELNRVLEFLSEEAVMPEAKEQILTIKPSRQFEEVKLLLKQTEDAYLFMAKYSAPVFSSQGNVPSVLARATVGATLSAKELLCVAEVLRVIRTVKKWREDFSGTPETSLDIYFNALNPNNYLENKITFAIKSEDEINDKASAALSDIRRKIAGASSKLRDNLEKIIRGGTAKYLQDAIITQRDGRYVVPVRAEYRGEIKGILHDTSSSGSTLFIEPMSVVETNNEIRVLKAKEQEEIARILAELSAEVAEFADSIKYSHNSLISLCTIFAKAKLAYKMGAIVPKINDRGYIYLKNARHPLIDRRKVVPITVTLGEEYDTLIITGPNTGGKTVTLKTVGLLTLMAMCGLMIPADDNSEIAVFNKIFADIGDEQSIEQSLSTFSSHMVNIISILDEFDNNSLVLFDELCAGTDPIEGAALAKAILMHLTENGSKTVATTHYPELKSYALDSLRVQNASCEFDIATLKPTYKLIIGVPGRSNAFEISRKLGLGDFIIDSARNQVTEDDMRFERVVASLEKARQEAEEERAKVSRLKMDLYESKKRTENIENELRIKQEKLMEQTREKASRIIEDARNKSSILLNQLEESKKALTAENAAKSIENARLNYKKTLDELDNLADPVENRQDNREKLDKMPQKNDIVIISSINKDATVIDTDDKGKRVFVMSGSMKMWVKLDDLRIKKSAQTTEIKKTRKVSKMVSNAARNVSGEVDLRGMASDEALMELDKYIDNAILSHLESIRIIHGKGTGVLRKAVQSYLRSHKSIKTFRLGVFGEGEDGVTIAEFKE